MASPNNMARNRGIWSTGEPFVWLTAGALSVTILSIVILILVVATNGLGVMWPATVTRFTQTDGQVVVGNITGRDKAGIDTPARYQVKTANRDLYGLDFRWIPEDTIAKTDHPEEVVMVERREWGNFCGFLKSLPESGGASDWASFQAALAEVEVQKEALDEFAVQMSALNQQLLGYKDALAKLVYEKGPEETRQELSNQISAVEGEFEGLLAQQTSANDRVRSKTAIFADGSGTEQTIVLADIVRAYQPNAMGALAKSSFYMEKLWELIFDEPRESNTEGGLFPAIFGTIILIFLMSVLSFPLGVIAGVYLRLYAKNGPLLYVVRIAVNNLAGIPSIVYGIFGLGFFVYGIGGSIDSLFYPHRLPTPTFGTGGILWASLTLGLLTVPVVIVATEEGLGSIPRSMREGSYALGATRFQTLVRVLLPMAAPGIMTGFILAMARAAGEVAPLMITGVVKLAPTLPVDGNFPYFHLERKFMHLGFHIFDIGFQSPNVEAAKPMVFVTTLLLVLIVMIMSSVAIYLRNQIRKRHSVTHL
ncbi:MAG: phosphate ABC transporter permease PstA [Candidatus Hydrogenedentes bacterium]|nr:phosphate ABC transporter permease PstA [Candidatus Hydrogenedentota bacterium]